MDEYGSHLTHMPHNGIQYFARDYLRSLPQTPEVVRLLHTLNSKLIEYELSIGLDRWRQIHQPEKHAGPTTTSGR